jgi:AAA15 family ATPase/GTPase
MHSVQININAVNKTIKDLGDIRFYATQAKCSQTDDPIQKRTIFVQNLTRNLKIQTHHPVITLAAYQRDALAALHPDTENFNNLSKAIEELKAELRCLGYIC